MILFNHHDGNHTLGLSARPGLDLFTRRIEILFSQGYRQPDKQKGIVDFVIGERPPDNSNFILLRHLEALLMSPL